MNCISLDSIGQAGFAHDFGAIQGKRSSVEDVFDSFVFLPPSPFSTIMFILATHIPILMKVPTARRSLTQKMHNTLKVISAGVLERSRKEKEMDAVSSDMSRSIIGALRG